MAVSKVTVIGAGTIGASWAAFFLSRGLRVSVQDPDRRRSSYLEAYLAQSWPTLQRLNPGSPPSPDQWTFHSDIATAVFDTGYVQECVPDDFALKRRVFAELDTAVPSGVVVASSTSSLIMSNLQRGLATSARFVVAHPFNPPHLIPLVEIVGGRETSEAAIEACAAFLALHGKYILRLRKETIGHVVNRLQSALLQEAICLVRDGVVDVGDIDKGIEYGPALRWALMGPFLTFHLGAQNAGISGYLRHFGTAYQEMWSDLGRVEELNAELVERISTGVDREADGRSISDLTRTRDAQLMELLLTKTLWVGQELPDTNSVA